VGHSIEEKVKLNVAEKRIRLSSKPATLAVMRLYYTKIGRLTAGIVSTHMRNQY